MEPFRGLPRKENLFLMEGWIPKLRNGEYLCRTLHQSVDPCQTSLSMEIGDTTGGYQVAVIIDSKSSKFPVGKLIIGGYGWKTHHIYNGKSLPGLNFHPFVIPDDCSDISAEDFIGVMGIPGLSAYVGLYKICQPRPGETIVISAAAGGVGNLVGQMAKLKGYTVLGVVGSDLKGEWIEEHLHFDGFINYKDDNLANDLKKLAPNGVDMYFDNVGGNFAFGRIAVCGAISLYYDIEDSKALTIQADMVRNSLKMIGFRIADYKEEFISIMRNIAPLLRNGSLKPIGTMTRGFGKTHEAFCDMLRGESIGKAFVEL